MPMEKKPASGRPGKSRRARVSAEDLKFISENQRLSGFLGKITPAMRAYKPDRRAIAKSAKRFGAQVPSSKKPAKPRITRFNSPHV